MLRSTAIFLFALDVLCAIPGCADKITDEQPDAGATDPPTGKVRTMRGSDATYTTIVDASSMTDWTYADFETGGELPAIGSWDLRFQRFHISTNGGVSGSGGVTVAPVTGVAFAAVTAPPAGGYLADAADGNGDGMPDYALERGDGWYDYDPVTHKLSPRSIVWIVKTAGGATLKLEILGYYDSAGTSGWLTLHWGPL
jgi:HmuY protein